MLFSVCEKACIGFLDATSSILKKAGNRKELIAGFYCSITITTDSAVSNSISLLSPRSPARARWALLRLSQAEPGARPGSQLPGVGSSSGWWQRCFLPLWNSWHLFSSSPRPAGECLLLHLVSFMGSPNKVRPTLDNRNDCLRVTHWGP